MAWSARTRKLSARAIGYFCIFVFFSLTSYMVYVYYAVLASSALEKKNYRKFIFHFLYGNWLMINLYFNFISAWLISPGLAKNYQILATQYSVCKKCAVNKPPRTHHCAWCDLCILKFDHHCPWLNNCVGFYNHRYFFQFCCYMAIACVYGGTFGFREYQIARLGQQEFYYKDSLFHPFIILETMEIPGFITYYIFIAGYTIAFLLIGLILWHGRMIGRGETSLERVLNQNYTQQCHEQGFVFVNPYNFGFLENWKRFLGVRTIGQFIGKVLLPSTHKPDGNGITWDSYNVNSNLQSHRQGPKRLTRPVAFPPGVHPNYPDGYPVTRYPPIIPPWERQPKPVYTSSGYQPKTEIDESIKNR